MRQSPRKLLERTRSGRSGAERDPNMTIAEQKTNAPDVAFGYRLRFARERRGSTPAEVSRLLGVSERTLIRWEAGNAAPRSNRMPIIAGTLNVPMRWLMSGEGQLDELKVEERSLRERYVELLEEVRSIKDFSIGAANRLADIEMRLHSLASKTGRGDVVADI